MGNPESCRFNNYSVTMKRFIYISLCASLFLYGCEKSQVANNSSSTENEIIMPSGEYIQFNTEALTRGVLINGGTLQDSLDVIGYKYSSTWEAFKSQAMPNVFPRVVGETTYGHVETIRYDASGYHLYDDPVEWTADNYAFFAYYPCANAEETETLSYVIVTSEEEYEGTPYIDYTLNVANVSEHIDVMTASVTNTHKQASKQGVNLTMQHRLSALDFVGYSYVNAKAVNELYEGTEGWTNIPEDASVEIVINDLSITLDGLAYNQARISLDQSEDMDSSVEGVQNMIPSVGYDHSTTRKFTYVSELDPLSFRDGVTTFLSEKMTGATDNGCPMILIPQNSTLTCTINITYSIKVGDQILGTYSPTDNNSEEINVLAAGVYNYVLVGFTKTGIHLKVEQNAQWDEINVDHQFE